MTQLPIFPENAFRTRLTVIVDLSLLSISKMDDIQRYELGEAIIELLNDWIRKLKNMGVEQSPTTPFNIALFDISDKWVGDMTMLLKQLDVICFQELENKFPWLEPSLIAFN